MDHIGCTEQNPLSSVKKRDILFYSEKNTLPINEEKTKLSI